MTGIIETIGEIIKSFNDEEKKPPLHIGEAMTLWTALTAFQEARALYQASLNMTTDGELIHVLQNAVKASKSDYELIKKKMIKEGVPLPAMNEDKPKSSPGAVPEGVKLTDDEIANLISVKIAFAITFCAQSISTSTRTDIGLLFLQIQTELMKFAIPLKNLMKARGWLKEPPAYHPPGAPEM